jgi:hypothetical protein
MISTASYIVPEKSDTASYETRVPSNGQRVLVVIVNSTANFRPATDEMNTKQPTIEPDVYHWVPDSLALGSWISIFILLAGLISGFVFNVSWSIIVITLGFAGIAFFSALIEKLGGENIAAQEK